MAVLVPKARAIEKTKELIGRCMTQFGLTRMLPLYRELDGMGTKTISATATGVLFEKKPVPKATVFVVFGLSLDGDLAKLDYINIKVNEKTLYKIPVTLIDAQPDDGVFFEPIAFIPGQRIIIDTYNTDTTDATVDFQLHGYYLFK